LSLHMGVYEYGFIGSLIFAPFIPVFEETPREISDFE
jgi:hypothetical protein